MEPLPAVETATATALPTAPPTPAAALKNANLQSLKPGEKVNFSAAGLPPDVPVLVGIGKVGGTPGMVDAGQTDADGAYKASVVIPSSAPAGEKWVVTIFGTTNPQFRVNSPPFMIAP